MKQRGSILLYALVAIGLVGALYGLYNAIDSRAFARGQAQKQAEWDAANRVAEDEERARRTEVARQLLLEEKRRLVAEQAAKTNHTQWQEAVRESRRRGNTLAECTQAAEPAGPSAGADAAGAAGVGLRAPGLGGGGHAAGAAGVRLTAEFVRLYDGAWTGLAGEPLFGIAAGREAPAAAGAAWRSVDELLDVHGHNAQSCSADRRELDTLIRRIEAAEQGWTLKARPQ